jgi:hypothetical protein
MAQGSIEEMEHADKLVTHYLSMASQHAGHRPAASTEREGSARL